MIWAPWFFESASMIDLMSLRRSTPRKMEFDGRYREYADARQKALDKFVDSGYDDADPASAGSNLDDVDTARFWPPTAPNQPPVSPPPPAGQELDI